MAGMSRKEISRIVEHVQPQGVNVTRTTKGLMLRLPDDRTTMIHFTTSDHRAAANLRAELKRSGVTWPFDGGADLAKSITEAKLLRKTVEQARELLAAAGNPSPLHIREAQRILFPAAPDARHNGHPTAQRLYALGWRPAPGKVKNRLWLRPLELEPDPTWLVPAEDVQQAPEPTEPELTEPESPPTPPPAPEPREFLDTVGSWTVDLAALPGEITLQQTLQVLSAAGVELELRVWRGVGAQGLEP